MATSLADAPAARFSVLADNTVFPSTWTRHRCTPTAEVGCALIFFPGGSTGSSAALETLVPHRSFGREPLHCIVQYR
ncbi:hypothetical protein [Streptomyces sp. 3213.3]|uniref:hypothetical protein n=1 Tax=Streptomyces sp. 3213.3 TaxID=1855348 RepID=UPI001041FD28|nr:hypothetical protein [Streptomyces sp. 3213.3]